MSISCMYRGDGAVKVRKQSSIPYNGHRKRNFVILAAEGSPEELLATITIFVHLASRLAHRSVRGGGTRRDNNRNEIMQHDQ
jgi:hypothetical protein